MTTSLKLRRGTTAQHASFTGAEGEVTVDTTKDTVVVHDGVTAGGVPLAKEASLAAKADTTYVDGRLNTTFAFKNRIINGDMRIDQRNAGAAINSTTNSTVWPVDRFVVDNSGSGTVSCQRSTVAPAGFVNSLGLTVSATDTPSAGDYLLLTQQIEGFNTADLNWGTANAKTATLSFWVRGSLIGTYGASIRGGTSNYSYPFNYSISAANTWEYKTITIPGTALVAFETGNGRGFQIMWDLGSGSNFNGTLNTWQAGSFWRTSGCVNLVSNASATFYLTGVQLEVGASATPFDTRAYGTELALCQRYYAKMNSTISNGACGAGVARSSTASNVFIKLPVSMRVIPTVSYSSAYLNYNSDVYQLVNSNSGVQGGTDSINYFPNSSTAGMTSGYPVLLAIGSGGYVDFTSEL